MNSVPRWASSKRPTRACDGAGERALGVAEELGFGERLGDRRGVERHEPLVRARAVVVDGPRDQLLAGAGLALDQHGAVHRRHELEALEDRLHGAALADHLIEAIAVAELRAQLGVFLAELEQKLATIKAKTPEFPVVVKGDRQMQYQGVIDVLDVLGRLGLANIGLAVDARK